MSTQTATTTTGTSRTGTTTSSVFEGTIPLPLAGMTARFWSSPKKQSDDSNNNKLMTSLMSEKASGLVTDRSVSMSVLENGKDATAMPGPEVEGAQIRIQELETQVKGLNEKAVATGEFGHA